MRIDTFTHLVYRCMYPSSVYIHVCCSVLQCVAVCMHTCMHLVYTYKYIFVSTMPQKANAIPHSNTHETHVFRAVCCSVSQCVAVCCSVLRCVVVCCSVLQCVAVCCSVLQRVAVSCSVLNVCMQCVAVCCSVLQRAPSSLFPQNASALPNPILTKQRVAACCSVLQRVAVCCSVLQCVAVHRLIQY